MTNIMLDLETMGINPNAAIIAIGAVEFDLATSQIGDKFYEVIDLESAVAAGGVIDASTVIWWMKQNEAARAEFSRQGAPIEEALNRFSRWMKARGKDVKVWGDGAAFDNVILMSAYRNAGIPAPWQYWNDRCYRTVKNMYPDIKAQQKGVCHNAVDDAESQVLHLIEMIGVKSEQI